MKKVSLTVSLPAPQMSGKMSLEETLVKRRSVREFWNEALSLEMISQLLWSLQGVLDTDGRRTAPSAGARYPLEIYLAAQDGFFCYDPYKNELGKLGENDLRPALCKASLDQEAVKEAPAVFVIAAVFERVASRYGAKRGERYVHMECGHAAQNLLLQAVSLGLASVLIGAFNDTDVAQTLGLPDDEQVMYLVPVGYPS